MMHVERITPIVKLNLKLQNIYLCDYSDTYILVSETITAPSTEAVAKANYRKNIIIKNCVPFTGCISEINNTQIDNAKDIDIVMSMCNSIEYRNEK